MRSNQAILDELETGEIEMSDGSKRLGVFKEDVLEAMKLAQKEAIQEFARNITKEFKDEGND